MWQLGKCVAGSPMAVVRMIRGPGLTEEEQKEKDESTAERKIMDMMNNRFAKRIGGCTIHADSNEVVLLEQSWSSLKVIDSNGDRKPKKRDRIRFQVGLELLGDDDYENFEFAFDEMNVTNEYLATLTKKIEGEWDETKEVRVWWCPPITDVEIKQRHDAKKRKDAIEKKKSDALIKRQIRVAQMAERLGEDSALAKRMKLAAGIVEEEEEDDEEEEREEEETKEEESDESSEEDED